MLIDDLIPPITKKIAQKFIRPKNVFTSFEEANYAVKKYNGYDDNELINAVYYKTIKFIDTLKSTTASFILDQHHLFLLTTLSLIQGKNKIKVLDFGGAFGTHYFIAKSFLKDRHFDWTVVELPEVIRLGRSLQTEELSFVDIQGDFSKYLGHYDLVLTSCTLPHMSSPQQALAFLVQQNAPYLALLRLGVTPAQEDLWTIHKAHYKDCGPGEPLANCPNKVAAFTFCMMAKHNVDTALKNYELILSSHDLSGTISVPGKMVQGYNRLYRKKDG